TGEVGAVVAVTENICEDRLHVRVARRSGSEARGGDRVGADDLKEEARRPLHTAVGGSAAKRGKVAADVGGEQLVDQAQAVALVAGGLAAEGDEGRDFGGIGRVVARSIERALLRPRLSLPAHVP